VRFQAVFYNSDSEPREFISRLTRLAEEGSVAKRFFFILLEKQKEFTDKTHYIQYRCMMQEKNQSPRPLSGDTASDFFCEPIRLPIAICGANSYKWLR